MGETVLDPACGTGGMEEDGIESNFPSEFRTRETAGLFLVLLMKILKPGGRGFEERPAGAKGFSERNIGYMIRFVREYSTPPIVQRAAAKLVQPPAAQSGPVDRESVEIMPQPVAQLALPAHILFGLPWFHHIVLIEKLKDLPTRYWYARQVIELEEIEAEMESLTEAQRHGGDGNS